MKFQELTPEAQQKVLEQQAGSLDYEWWDSTIEDFVAICRCMGIETGVTSVLFSGFYSQGDGAGFSGRCYLQAALAAETGIQQYAPQDTELHGIANALATAAQMYMTTTVLLTGEEFVFSPYVTIALGRGYIVSADSAFDNFSEYPADHELDNDATAAVQVAAQDLSRWLYKTLEAEWEYLTSAQPIIDQGLEYDEDGNELLT